MILDLRDYTPLSVYKIYGARSCQFVDPKIPIIHRLLSEHFNIRPIVNNYHLGGQLTERGFRLPTSKTGAPLSQHRFGRALDFTIPGLSAQEVYDDILQSPQFLIDVGCTTIEDIAYTRRGNWVHLDCRDLGRVITELHIVVP